MYDLSPGNFFFLYFSPIRCQWSISVLFFFIILVQFAEFKLLSCPRIGFFFKLRFHSLFCRQRKRQLHFRSSFAMCLFWFFSSSCTRFVSVHCWSFYFYVCVCVFYLCSMLANRQRKVIAPCRLLPLISMFHRSFSFTLCVSVLSQYTLTMSTVVLCAVPLLTTP